MDAKTFDNLIDGYLEDRLSEEETAQFNEVLRQSRSARERFWEHARLQSYLVELAERKVGEDASQRIAAADAIAILQELEALAETELRDATPKPAPKAPTDRRHPARLTPVIARLGPMTRSLAAAAVAGIVLLLGWQLIIGPGDPSDTPSTKTADTADPAPAPLPQAYATLARGFDTRWDGPAPGVGQPLDRSATYTLTHGTIDLELNSGATVALSAPVRFSIQQDNTLALTRGHAYAVVPESAIGFTVQTPQGQVVDLGTEFGVRVDEQGAGEVVVFKGLVEAVSSDSTQEPVKIPEQFGGKLRAGERVGDSIDQIGAFQTEAYVRDWDKVVYHPVVDKAAYHPAAPPDLNDNAFEADHIQVIAEARGVELKHPIDVFRLAVDADVRLTGNAERRRLKPGQTVNSFLVHLDRPGQGGKAEIRDVVLTFPGEVLGVIKDPDSMTATDRLLGAEDTRYPEPGTFSYRSTLDPYNSPLVESALLSSDKRTLTLVFGTSNIDAVRVIVRNTDDDARQR